MKNKNNITIGAMIIILIAGAASLVSADAIIVKGLYQSPSEWSFTGKGTYLGYSFKETDVYTLNNAKGIAVEYDFKGPGSGLLWGAGIEYFFDRLVPQVAVKGKFENSPAGPFTYSGKLESKNAWVQTTYLAGYGKYYFNDSFFLGASIKYPFVSLKGSDWSSDCSIGSEYSFGGNVGLISGDYVGEIYVGSDNLIFNTVDPDGNKVTNKVSQSIIQFSIGYMFMLGKRTEQNLGSEEKADDEHSEPEKVLVPISANAQQAWPTVSNLERSVTQDLERLYELKEKGAIIEEEYDTQKKKLLQ